MSKLQAPIANGNILMVNFPHMPMLHDFIIHAQITQYSVTQAEEGVMLSIPITEALENHSTGLVHGARARAKAAEKPDPKPPTGGGSPDGTPPSGGTPGTPVIETYTFTEAKAA
ncbi:hypothetical protein vB_PsyM_KIL2_0105 [Pseudomonas phage vB_PsyM_KIL2]|uniref:Uncharacterized protein n=1 Tax=Pseudomonas phage vB_PsyM_KIL2 TaxID=1777066 RepID=A0A142IE50_9CAUD|nr:hypothetical protein vB_PsyM_KIL2_0105 [Pseudomonas phage vB_PsyM_KIL2]